MRLGEPAALAVYCLDASQCAALNEDWSSGGWESRLAFQRRLLGCLSGLHASTAEGGQQVALVASHAGRASVVLPPTAARTALLPALDCVPTGGACSPVAALKLALLVARRYASAHITAFVASPCSLPPAEAEDLHARIHAAPGVTVDVVVLAARQELGEEAVTGLAALGGAPLGGSHAGEDGGGEGTAAAAAVGTGRGGGQPGQCRVVHVRPDAPADESWQQLEVILEQLEWGDGAPSSSEAEAGPAPAAAPVGTGEEAEAAAEASRAVRAQRPGTQHSRHPGAPARIRRAPARHSGDPLRRPRAPLLAARSGVHQPALCRHESLDWLGHLSVDGMMRPWLPTYASLGTRMGQRSKGGAAAREGSAAGASEPCFLQVCPVPRYRTLLKMSAGLMRSSTQPAAAPRSPRGRRPAGGSGGGGSEYASLSAALLRGLEELQLDDDAAAAPAASSQPTAAQHGQGAPASDSATPTASAPAPPPASAAARSLPEGQEGDAAPAPLPEATRLAPDRRRGTLRVLQAVKEPLQLRLAWVPDEPTSVASGSTHSAAGAGAFDMFATATSGAAAGALGLPGMPVAAPGAPPPQPNQPILHRGIELWEAGASFELELPLDAEAAAVSGRALPNGAQLLLFGGRSGGQSGSRDRVPGAAGAPAAAFWLQQRWEEGCLAALPPAAPGAGAAARREEGTPVEGAAGDPVPAPAADAVAAAAALAGLLASPPPVDLRQMRRDVKDGLLQVTPVMVGPLPSKFIQDMLGARAAIMRAIGVENCDRGPEAAAGSGSNTGGTSGSAATSDGPAGHASAAGSKPAEERQSSSAAPTIEGPSEAAGGCGGGISKRRRPEDDATGAARLAHHRRAAVSLLEQPGEQPRDMESSAGAMEAVLGVAAAQQQGEQIESAAGSAGPLLEPGSGSSSCALPVPASQQAAPQREAPACSAYSDGSTPFGTPMHIVPSRLVGVLGSAPAAGGSGEAAEGAEHDQQQERVAAAGVDAAAIAAEQRRLEEGDDSAFDPPVLFELE